MIKYIYIGFCLLASAHLFAQDVLEKQKQELIEESGKLYRSERASWLASDILMEKYATTSKIGGYVSYEYGDQVISIFVSKGDKPNVLFEVSFPSENVSTKKAKVNQEERAMTAVESNFFNLRNAGMESIYSDSTINWYKNTNFNVVPLIDEEKGLRVYAICASTKPELFCLGNDYLFIFDENYKLTNKKALHKNILVFELNKKENVVGAMHNHTDESGQLPSPTDMCSLQLYAELTGMETHMVLSSAYQSIIKCASGQLTIIPNTVNKSFKEIIEEEEKKKSGN